MNRNEALRLLGLSADATSEEVKAAYRETAQILHPDRFASNKKLQERATEQFKNLSNTTINTFLTTIKDICATKNTSRKIDRNHFERIRESLFVSVAGNANFWQCLKAIINSKHNNLITRIETDQLLTESDIRLLCLVGCGFSNTSIILLTTYTNLHSVSNRKRIIADKLKLSATLEELFTTEG